jgi:hypothetical protein
MGLLKIWLRGLISRSEVKLGPQQAADRRNAARKNQLGYSFFLKPH